VEKGCRNCLTAWETNGGNINPFSRIAGKCWKIVVVKVALTETMVGLANPILEWW